MALISETIPNLVNGVSQQPPTLRLASQAEMQENGYSSVVEGLKKRPPTQHIKKIISGTLADSKVHMINRDTTERYFVVVTQNSLRVFDLLGVEKTVATPDGVGYLNDAAPSSTFRLLTIQDHTFVVNTMKTVAMSPVLLAPAKAEALIYVKQGNYAINYVIKIEFDGTEYEVASFTTPDATIAQIKTDFIADALRDDLVESLQTAWAPSTAYTLNEIRTNGGMRFVVITAGTSAASGGPLVAGADVTDGTVHWKYIGSGDSFTVTLEGSTIYIRRDEATTMVVKASDSNGDKNMVLVQDKLQRFTDLPNVAPRDFTVKIQGDLTSEKDDYWVKFEPTNAATTFDRGVWKEARAPGMTYQFDATTMPHTLVRNADGTFTFAKATWGERVVGDTESSPDPSFVGLKLNDVYFFKNRLGFLADENYILSRAGGKYFDFFRSTVTTLLDDDPIDVAVSHTKVSKLRHAIQASKKLFLFADQTQFEVSSGSLLTPKTAGADVTTEFENSPLVRPVSAGKNVYFVVEKGAYSGVREFFVSDKTETADAANITAHVPAYIPSSVFKMTGATNEEVLALISKASGQRQFAWVYKYYWNDDQKLQSSWSRWNFGTGTVMLDAHFLDTDLWCLIQRTDGVYIEKISVEPFRQDPGFLYEILLDRKITDLHCTVVYDAVNDWTTWTLPYAENATLRIVTRQGGAEKLGVAYTYTRPSSTTIRVLGNKATQPVFIGTTYLWEYEFSEPVLKQSKGEGRGETPVTGGRLQIRRYRLANDRTGYFRVRVILTDGQTYVYTFAGRTLGAGGSPIGTNTLESGTFNFPVKSKSNRFRAILESDSFAPAHIQSAEWEALYVLRSSRA